MKIYSALITILLAGTLLSQNKPTSIPPRQFQVLFQEVNTFPLDENNIEICYSYRIPFNRLVFEKNNNLYTASFNIFYEIIRAQGDVIKRDFFEGKIEVDNFADTDTDDKFFQGLLKSKVKRDVYTLTSILVDGNSRIEHKLKDLKIDSSSVFLAPIVTEGEYENCNGESVLVLSNWENSIPFTNSSHNIYIPLVDSSINISKIQIINEDDTLFANAPFNFSSIAPPEICNGKIIIPNNNEIKYKALELKNLSSRFKEGNLSVSVFSDKPTKPLKTFHLQVRWYKKPHILNMPELAIKVLSNIESPDLIDSLLSGSEKYYPHTLYNYWKRLDPRQETEYNELMYEYYERVDYAAMNFSSINGRRGFETDRGKIYIQFGQPEKIDRGSNMNGKITETWYYQRQNRVFTFTDKSGTGEFKLDNG